MPESPTSTTPADSTAASPAPAAKKKRALGNWSFNLGLLALLAEIGLTVSIWATAASVQAGIDAGEGVDVASGSVTLIAQIATVVFWAGLALAVLAVLLGAIAIATGRGRSSAVWGVLFGAVVIVLRILAFAGILDLVEIAGGGLL
jgi:hypothetical protein